MSKVLTNCALIDVVAKQRVADAAIVVSGDTVAWAGPRSQWTGPEPNDELIDMGGLNVLPGLWDMHMHLGMTVLKTGGRREWGLGVPSNTMFSYRRALAFLYSGVTSLRLVGSADDGADFLLRDSINDGEYIGPRLLTAGPGISPTGGHGYNGHGGCDGPYEFRKAARHILWQGADLIKICITGGMGGRYETVDAPQIMRDEIAATIEVSHEWGKHVAAHCASPEVTIMCAELGLDTVEHGYCLNEAALEVMKQKGTAYVATLVVSDDASYWEDLDVAPWAMKKIRQVHDVHRRAVELAIKNGVTLAIGTDLPTAYKDDAIVTVREMELFEGLGMPPIDVIRAATVVPAKICGLEGKVGAIAAGQSADLIAVPEDPFATVSNLRDVRFVMMRGDTVKDSIAGHTPIGLPAGMLKGPC